MKSPQDANGPAKGSSGVTDDLASRIASAKQGRMAATQDGVGAGAVKDMSGLGRAARLGSEFIAAILVGAGIGYLLDLWLGTRPWIMLGMLLVGFAAGILNITRSVGEMNRASPPPPGSDLGPGDDEEDR